MNYIYIFHNNTIQNTNSMFNIGQFIKGVVVKRPSAKCKTPYVADVMLENGDMVLAHSAALGCCGYCDKDATVLMIKVDNTKNVCSHKIIVAEDYEREQYQLIGVDPKLAEKIVFSCLDNNSFSWLNHLNLLQKEKKFLNSRFDFTGLDENNKQFILEVKNVPLADYVDMLAKDRKKIDTSSYDYNDKIAYFPDGYRKNIKDTVSPRALKHIEELTTIKKENPEIRTILCFVIQRKDVSSFQPSIIDEKYRNAVLTAHENNVEIRAIQTWWNYDGSVSLINDSLKVNI